MSVKRVLGRVWHSQQSNFDARDPFLLTQTVLYAGDASSASHACNLRERRAEVSEGGSSPESLLCSEGGLRRTLDAERGRCEHAGGRNLGLLGRAGSHIREDVEVVLGIQLLITEQRCR